MITDDLKLYVLFVLQHGFSNNKELIYSVFPINSRATDKPCKIGINDHISSSLTVMGANFFDVLLWGHVNSIWSYGKLY